MGNDAGMCRGTAQGNGAARERLVERRRAAPVVLLLDEGLELRGSSGEGRDAWQRFARALRELIASHGGDLREDRHVATMTPDETHAVRLMRLGDDGGYVVLMEPFQVRDRMLSVGERYALTVRERQVARLLARGANTGQIAAELGIASSTAVIHVKSIMAKTGTRTRAAAVGRLLE